MSRRICIDIDGVIAAEDGCPGKDPWEEYFSGVLVISGAKESIQRLQNDGWYIILHSSRREESRTLTQEWLGKHEIPYNELVLEKPEADIYLDNRAHRFVGWEELLRGLL